MRIAVSGSHSTGKSTLIAAFIARRAHYTHEPEAYEELADQIAVSGSEGPDAEGLGTLLEHTMSVVASHAPGAAVIFERSPIDYLAYAAATRSISRSDRADFIRTYIPAVREAVRHLDLIAFLPVSSTGPVTARPHEDEGFRERVDEMLRRALIDDEYDVFVDGAAPCVVELSPVPDRQLAELMRRTASDEQP